jgi:hypothetical protein
MRGFAIVVSRMPSWPVKRSAPSTASVPLRGSSAIAPASCSLKNAGVA